MPEILNIKVIYSYNSYSYLEYLISWFANEYNYDNKDELIKEAHKRYGEYTDQAVIKYMKLLQTGMSNPMRALYKLIDILEVEK